MPGSFQTNSSGHARFANMRTDPSTPGSPLVQSSPVADNDAQASGKRLKGISPDPRSEPQVWFFKLKYGHWCNGTFPANDFRPENTFAPRLEGIPSDIHFVEVATRKQVPVTGEMLGVIGQLYPDATFSVVVGHAPSEAREEGVKGAGLSAFASMFKNELLEGESYRANICKLDWPKGQVINMKDTEENRLALQRVQEAYGKLPGEFCALGELEEKGHILVMRGYLSPDTIPFPGQVAKTKLETLASTVSQKIEAHMGAHVPQA
ncbi:hypothetical protein QBC46DRAFT_411710 [Diplogelasinospora grovesii]|uniref:Uncharacterized protein n=1 Tax=Diplogelasinospora grovesii TaxID=303347 RepID=A0AAN6S1R6_9PEZI|nr:hypothetical protein QBC46DRAFT_411710 [Diplogelasinospora grovesii]